MMDITKKAAEILVECGYAKQYPPPDAPMEVKMGMDTRWKLAFIVKADGCIIRVDHFIDSYHGHMQAFALEDWLVVNHKKLWLLSMNEFGFDDRPKHQWRLGRIKWCLGKLINEN